MGEWEEERNVQIGRRSWTLSKRLSGGGHLTRMPQLWMTEMARELLYLGLYFRAIGLMLQLPGGAEYEWVGDDKIEGAAYYEGAAPPQGLWDAINESNRDMLFSVLAECLNRLGAADLMKQVPNANFVQRELTQEWQELLEKCEPIKNGLLTVVAECLDALIVMLGRHEVDQGRLPARQ